MAGKKRYKVKDQNKTRVTMLERTNMIMKLIGLRIKRKENKLKNVTETVKKKMKRTKKIILANIKERK